MSDSAAIVMKMLRDAAERGDPCPSNRTMARDGGFDSDYVVSRDLKRLAASGEITIQRLGETRQRRVMVDGAWTDWSALNNNQSSSGHRVESAMDRLGEENDPWRDLPPNCFR